MDSYKPAVAVLIGLVLASVIQKEDVVLESARDLRHAEIVLMTHRANEAAVQRAVAEIDSLAVVAEVGSVVRVEDS